MYYRNLGSTCFRYYSNLGSTHFVYYRNLGSTHFCTTGIWEVHVLSTTGIWEVPCSVLQEFGKYSRAFFVFFRRPGCPRPAPSCNCGFIVPRSFPNCNTSTAAHFGSLALCEFARCCMRLRTKDLSRKIGWQPRLSPKRRINRKGSAGSPAQAIRQL